MLRLLGITGILLLSGTLSFGQETKTSPKETKAGAAKS